VSRDESNRFSRIIPLFGPLNPYLLNYSLKQTSTRPVKFARNRQQHHVAITWKIGYCDILVRLFFCPGDATKLPTNGIIQQNIRQKDREIKSDPAHVSSFGRIVSG